MPEKKNGNTFVQNSAIDTAPDKLYTLLRQLEKYAPLLTLLENRKSSPSDGLESELKGVSDMSKRLKQRVRIGANENGEPIYKWADGYSVDELNDNIVRVYIENGLLAKFSGNTPLAKKIDKHKSCPTFEEYTRQWFDTYKAPNLKPTTCKGYRSNLARHIYPFFGKMRLDEITTDDIQRFLNEKEPLARNTVHTMLVLLGESLHSAYEDKLIPTDPSMSKRLTITSKGKKERSALTPEQLLSQAKDYFLKAEDLFSNRAKISNLRDAIIRAQAQRDETMAAIDAEYSDASRLAHLKELLTGN